MIWTFHQPGSIPGIPQPDGPYAGVTVEVDDATNTVLKVMPLARHGEFIATPADEVGATSTEKPESEKDKKPAH
jgi:hypothetical protein